MCKNARRTNAEAFVWMKRVFGKRRGIPGDTCFGEGELIS